MLRVTLFSLVLLLPLAGCGGGAAAPEPDPTVDPASFSPDFAHPYFPILSGMIRTYEGEDEGMFRREVVHTLEQRRDIAGVSCGQVRKEVFLDGDLAEVGTEWYAEDLEGNVWKFGEESFEAVDGVMARTADSWEVGVGDAIPWMNFPREPQLGDVYAGYRPGGEDSYEVHSLTETAVVPAGVYTNCMQVVENPDDPEDTDIILYARGTGRVSETNADGHAELTEVSSGGEPPRAP